MPQIQSLTFDRPVATPPRIVRRDEFGDLSADDTPPADFHSERYAAWSPTSFSSFVPFSSPQER